MLYLLLFVAKWMLYVILPLYILYLYGRSGQDYFKKLNICHEKPLPWVGNMLGILFQKKALRDVVINIYTRFPNSKICGFFEFRQPVLIVRDPELINKICIVDFDHFTDHLASSTEPVDPLFGSALIFLRGNIWRKMRHNFAPAFTKNKLKTSFTNIQEIIEQLDQYLIKMEGNEIELKDLFTRFSSDVMYSAAFGINIDSYQEPNNDFFKIASETANFNIIKGIKYFFHIAVPSFMIFLRVPIHHKNVRHFYMHLIRSVAHNQRSEKRPYFMQQLIQYQQHWTHIDITAQATFLFSASDTTSNIMCFACLELAVKPEIQKRLQAEIDDTNKNNKEITYEIIDGMVYLNMVISEALRKWSPLVLDRICVKPYTLKDEESTIEIQLKPGDGIYIPMVGIHHDPKYYPNPDIFDPDRFLEENKIKLLQSIYFPFGIGPRKCIGGRFALITIKALMFYILTKFNIEPCEKTQYPVKLKRNTFNISTENGIWVNIKKRNFKES